MSSDLLNQFEFLLGSIGVILSLFFGVFLLIKKLEGETAKAHRGK